MAYNNYYPVGYPQYFQAPQNVPASPQTGGNIIWVQGEAGAKSYLVAPNTTVQLWDSESQVIYLKSADGSGMPTMKVLDYTVRDSGRQSTPILAEGDYITREEFTAFKDEMKRLVEGGKNSGESDF